jgi:phosphate transport system substrate-binding protein
MSRRSGALLLTVLAMGAMLPTLARTTLIGAGTPDQLAVYSKWFTNYPATHPEVDIRYDATVGTGHGILAIEDGTVDFAGTEGPMTDEELKIFRDKHGAIVLHVPTVVEAVVPAYHVDGINAELNFTSETLAAIFLGKVTNWSDPLIAHTNPGTNLPNLPIVVVHRSGGRINHVWSDYLVKTSSAWSSLMGPPRDLIEWPADFGLSGSDEVQIVGLIKQTQRLHRFPEFSGGTDSKRTLWQGAQSRRRIHQGKPQLIDRRRSFAPPVRRFPSVDYG